MIIGLTGKKRSGKDTAAEYLIKEYKFIDYKFATPIKNMCKDIFLQDEEWVNGAYKETVDERWGVSSRTLQQLIGTELFRQHLPDCSKEFSDTIGDNIWCTRFKYWYDVLEGSPDVVVTDVRFLNEVEMIRNMGGIIVKVNRDSLRSNDSHSSEMEMEKIVADYTIHNNTSIEDLWKMIKHIYELEKK